MTSQRKTRTIYFFVLALIGLVSAWWLNGVAVARGQDYLQAWFSTEVDWVLSTDLLIVALAAAAFMVLEAKRLGMKRVWLYLVLAGITAMAFVFPLFLAMRELKLAKQDLAAPEGGRLETLTVAGRRVDVLVPADLSPESPVLVMHDGANLLVPRTETWNGQNWGIQEMIAEGRLLGARTPIVIGVHGLGPETRFTELAPEAILARHPEFWNDVPESLMPASTELLGDAYQAFIAEQVLPTVADRFGLKLTRDRTAISGSSMGGLASIYAMAKYPAVYGTAICLSTHWVFGGSAMVRELIGMLPRAGQHRISTDCGTIDIDEMYFGFQQEAVMALGKLGYERDLDFAATVYSGTGHNENWWAGRAHLAFNWWLVG